VRGKKIFKKVIVSLPQIRRLFYLKLFSKKFLHNNDFSPQNNNDIQIRLNCLTARVEKVFPEGKFEDLKEKNEFLCEEIQQMLLSKSTFVMRPIGKSFE
jgi:hypothetical protein